MAQQHTPRTVRGFGRAVADVEKDARIAELERELARARQDKERFRLGLEETFVENGRLNARLDSLLRVRAAAVDVILCTSSGQALARLEQAVAAAEAGDEGERPEELR